MRTLARQYVAGASCFLGRLVRRVCALILILVPSLNAALGTTDTAGRASLVYEAWTVEEGLPVNSVNRVFQGQEGYIWMATWDGLVRFDGVRFAVFNTSNYEGLPSNRIVQALQTPDGTLWLITEQQHLVRMRDDAFTHVNAGHELGEHGARTLYVDGDGRLWVGTDGGLYWLEDDLFVSVAADLITGSVTALLRDSGGDLWVGTRSDGLYRIAADNVLRFTTSDGLGSNWISVLEEDSTGTVWIGTSEGLQSHRTGRLVSPRRAATTPPVGMVRQIAPAPDERSVWISTENGIYLANHDEIRAVRVTPERVSLPFLRYGPDRAVWYGMGDLLFRDGEQVFQIPQRLPAERREIAEIRDLSWDHEGSLWIATHSSGVFRLNPSLFEIYSEPEGMVNRNVVSILEDRDGAIWFGMQAPGLSRLSGGQLRDVTPPGYEYFFLSLMQDKAGNLWGGTHRRGIVVCRLPELSCGPPPGGQPDPDAIVYALHQDSQGSIWAGTSTGLYRRQGDAWERAAVDVLPASSVVRAFLPARDGTLWMGTSATGLLAYRGGRFTSITNEDGLPIDLIRSLYEDDSGHIWVGTEGRGLARLSVVVGEDAGSVRVLAARVIRQRDGLFDDGIHRILADDEGRLWMSTNRGIFWVSRQQLDDFANGITSTVRSTPYTERDGLRNREANGGYHPAGIRARDGRLWFPTQDGAAVVDPARVRANLEAPAVVIERVVSGEDVFRAHVPLLELPPRTRNLEIDYTALSYLAPENVRFRYQLAGLSDTWVEAGTRRTAYYTQLPPGRYSFRVVASSSDGVWAETGATLAFRIAPAFFETRTFYLVALALLFGGVVAGFRFRERRLRRQARELEQLVDSRTAALRERELRLTAQNGRLEEQASRLRSLDDARTNFFQNVSHELRTPLTLTIGPLEDLRSSVGMPNGSTPPELDMALRNARRLLRLVNQILDVARLEAGHMQLAVVPTDLVEFVQGITSQFDGLAAARQVALEVLAESPTLPVPLDRDAMEKVLTNLLGNAFKFTPPGGWIRVTIDAVPDAEMGSCARIRVTDSGPGISEQDLPHVFDRFFQSAASSRSGVGTGIGLALAHELVDRHGGRLMVENDASGGARFTAYLPLTATLPAETPVAEAGIADALGSGLSSSFSVAAGEEASADATTLLVVDDNADLRAWIRHVFARRYRVVEADNGTMGLELARRLQPDLILADVMMPGMSGHALVEALRSDPETDFIPVILLTAQAARAQRLAGLQDGVEDYVVKPFDMPELEARVQNLIASRRRIRERLERRMIDLRTVDGTRSEADRQFVKRVRSAIEGRLDDPSFGVAELADAAFMDRSHLFRRTKELFGEAPSELIRRIRLEHAVRLLSSEAESTVAHVAYASGFNSVSYFCRVFRETYDKSPLEYRHDALAR